MNDAEGKPIVPGGFCWARVDAGTRLFNQGATAIVVVQAWEQLDPYTDIRNMFEQCGSDEGAKIIEILSGQLWPPVKPS